MSSTQIPVRRRRARRGSLERPINGRLYRSSFLVVVLPILLLAFASSRPGVLAAPQLPPNFDGPGAKSLAVEFASSYPDRRPGGAQALAAATWLRDQFRLFHLPIVSDRWRQHLPGGSVVELDNSWAVAAGRSKTAIVVMAHRDDLGVGPGANDNASGTAALLELARGYSGSGAAGAPVEPAHTIVFLSTDGGAFGGLGAERFARRSPFRIAALINLTAIAGSAGPRLILAGDASRTTPGVLAATAAQRITAAGGTAPGRTSVLGQLIDLAFPFTLGEQGPFVARGIPAISITTGGERPPDAFTDRTVDSVRLTALGRAAQSLLGSLDQGVELARGTPSFVWIGGRAIRGWAIEVLLVALLVPYLVTVTDLLANTRRRGLALGPAFATLALRAGVCGTIAIVFYAFGLLGAWPRGPARPPDPALPSSGDWAPLPLLAGAAIVLICWLVIRKRLAHARNEAGETLAGDTAALLALAVLALVVVAISPFALLLCLPALHAWLWLPQLRSRPGVLRLAVFGLGLIGPALVPLSLGVRFHLGFDAPWYLLTLLSLGYVSATAFLVTLAGVACAAQLTVGASRRYAP